MNTEEYFLRAIHSNAILKRHWVYSVFAVTTDPEGSLELDPYEYRLKRGEDGYYFLNQEHEWELIEGTVDRKPLARFHDRIQVNPHAVGNHTGKETIDTTYGNVLFNQLVLAIPFGGEIPFQTGQVDVGAIEDEILKRLVDDPENDDGESHAPAGKIYTREYLKFCDYGLSMVAYNSIAVESATRKSLTPHPEGRKRRQELIEKHKDELTDPAVVARIGDELEELDREWLKDDPSNDFYMVEEKKSFGKVRKKMFYLFGGESAFTDGTTVEFIAKSLEEGIDPEHLPAMINSLRFGSYNRGAQTQLGGESTKTIYRMLGTVRIAEDDCGSTLGIPTDINKTNKKKFIGFWVVDGHKSVLLTAENIDQYVDRYPELRGPLTCNTEGRNVCKRCVGEALSEQPQGVPAASAQLGGVFLTAFLKAMHGKTLKTQKWDMSKRLT